MGGCLLGCQTITFGDDQDKRFPELFRHLAQCGYDGVEVGFRRMRNVAPEDLQQMLQANELELCATHIGGNLEDPDQADKERNVLGVVLDYMEVLKTSVLMYSGIHYENREQLRRDIDTLSRAAELCRKRGVQLLYHNHDWEMADDARIVRALLKDGSDSIGFCPGIGWIAKGAQDPVEMMNLLGARIGMIHLKDFATMDPGCDTVVLGEGVVPLDRVAKTIDAMHSGLWIVAEQDFSIAEPPEIAVKKNAEYLKSAFSS